MLRIFLFVFLLSQSYSYAEEINLESPFYKLGWKNLENSKTSYVSIPTANASLEVLESEIYLDEKKTIKNYLEYETGVNTNIEDISENFILIDKENFYKVEIEYNSSGYVSSNRYKNFTKDQIMKTINDRSPPDLVSKISWVLEPKLSENHVVTFGYRVDWSDGDITYEYEGLVLGKEGYINTILVTDGDGSETTDFFEFYNSIIQGVSESIKFNEGFLYSDFKTEDYKSAYNLTNIIDGSFGIGLSTDPTNHIINCLVTTKALKSGGLTENDYPRFAGKVMELVVMDLRNQIADISEDEEMNVISGMYDAQSFSKNQNNITYTNTIELSGDNENDKVKYEYKNKIVFQNNKPKTFYANIDQTGFTFNEWNLKLNCRDYDYSSEEIAKAGEIPGKSKISKEAIEKLLKRVPKN